jgi:hypothetical protein
VFHAPLKTLGTWSSVEFGQVPQHLKCLKGVNGAGKRIDSPTRPFWQDVVQTACYGSSRRVLRGPRTGPIPTPRAFNGCTLLHPGTIHSSPVLPPPFKGADSLTLPAGATPHILRLQARVLGGVESTLADARLAISLTRRRY